MKDQLIEKIEECKKAQALIDQNVNKEIEAFEKWKQEQRDAYMIQRGMQISYEAMLHQAQSETIAQAHTEEMPELSHQDN